MSFGGFFWNARWRLVHRHLSRNLGESQVLPFQRHPPDDVLASPSSLHPWTSRAGCRTLNSVWASNMFPSLDLDLAPDRKANFQRLRPGRLSPSLRKRWILFSASRSFQRFATSPKNPPLPPPLSSGFRLLRCQSCLLFKFSIEKGWEESTVKSMSRCWIWAGERTQTAGSRRTAGTVICVGLDVSMTAMASYANSSNLASEREEESRSTGSQSLPSSQKGSSWDE